VAQTTLRYARKMRKIRSWSRTARVGLVALMVTSGVSAVSNAGLTLWLWSADGFPSEADIYFLELLEVFTELNWFLLAAANLGAAIGLAGTMVSLNRLLALAPEETTSITVPRKGDTAWIIVGWIIPLVGVFVLPRRLASQVDSLGVPNSAAIKRLGNTFIFGLLIASLALRFTTTLYSEAVELGTFAIVFALDATISLGLLLISLGMLRVIRALMQRSSQVDPSRSPSEG